MNSPSTEQIKLARKQAGLTQTKAAELIYSNRRTWQDWEYGITPMHPAIWELFQIKTKPR
jgi:DNA-binding transcriptional regulator YiaG